MTVTETQIKLYALTKEIMDLSQKYILTISPYEKEVLLEKINETNAKLEDLAIQYKEEEKD